MRIHFKLELIILKTCVKHTCFRDTSIVLKLLIFKIIGNIRDEPPITDKDFLKRRQNNRILKEVKKEKMMKYLKKC